MGRIGVSPALGLWRGFGVLGGFGVFRCFSWNRREGRRGRGASGFEFGQTGIGGSCTVITMGNSGGGLEAALAADIIFDFFLGAFTVNEFAGVRVVPLGESDLGGSGARMTRSWRFRGENGEGGRRF